MVGEGKEIHNIEIKNNSDATAYTNKVGTMRGNYKTESRRILVSYGAKPREYVINGVKYIVSSRFQKMKPKENNKLLSDRIKRFIRSDFAHLTNTEKCAIRDSGYVCSAAERKEHI